MVDLDDWIGRIRNRDPMTFEDAYHGERPSGKDVIPRLIEELKSSIDSYTRGKFAELLGEMGDNSVVPILIEELSNREPDARRWAVLALEMLSTVESLAAARNYRKDHPDEFA